ncbi:MAG: sel1 repeat family protein, partial [Gammaproteobacteria bacterium]|nr:sel1 repeat family protein [Gammaproteobacteria bacterium]
MKKDQIELTLEKYKGYYKAAEYQKALLLIQPMAESGEARAQYNLGVHYEHGHGVDQDDNLAARW